MSNIPLLFQLPSAWLVALLSEWLDMPSIGMLDTAISAKNYRPQFLDILRIMRSFSIDCFSEERGRGRLWSDIIVLTRCWWRWLSIRQIHVKNTIICGKTAVSDLAIPSMRKVVARKFRQVDLYYLVRNCPSLRSLDLSLASDGTVIDNGLSFVAKNLHQTLEEFRLAGVGFRRKDLIDVFRRCTHLRSVSLTDDTLKSVSLNELIPYGHLFDELHFEGTRRAIEGLLAKCSNLRKFTYHGSHKNKKQNALIMSAIHRSCPLLENLDLSNVKFNQQVTGADIFTLVGQTCKHLRKLTLDYCDLKPSTFRQIAGIETLKELALCYSDGLTDAGMALVTSMMLENLSILGPQLTELQSFAGTAISDSLEYLYLGIEYTQLDDFQVATAIAPCHKLKTLCVHSGSDGCLFGRNGLAGLQAMAVGCPLLAEVELHLTVSGIHFVGTHFTHLKSCDAYYNPVIDEDSEVAAEVFPPIEEVRTLYPAIKWAYSVM